MHKARVTKYWQDCHSRALDLQLPTYHDRCLAEAFQDNNIQNPPTNQSISHKLDRILWMTKPSPGFGMHRNIVGHRIL